MDGSGMRRRPAKVILCVASILLATGGAISHWHPLHTSRAWDQGSQRLDLRNGSLRWFFEAQRNQFCGSTPWTSRDLLLPGGFGLQISSDGYTAIALPGMRFEWCRQPAGYRRYGLRLRFFTLAVLAALYPIGSVALYHTRRLIRRCRGLCLNCAYDLQGDVSERCPERGTTVPGSAKRER